MLSLNLRRLAPALLLLAAGPAAAQTTEIDTIPGRFDFGKMWTYEYAPTEYFTETYGFDADQAWFDRVRLSVLRVPGCSASFVSPNGLVATNHHCVRGRIPAVAREGETLLDDGFYARTLEEERQIPGYYADRLIAAVDVSDEVLEAMDAAGGADARRAAREAAVARLTERLTREHGGDVHVEVRALYHGGRYSAYVFRRFTDVRLVAAVELQLGFFGGDPDNFTYPRYALDFAILRVYDEDGEPFESEQHLGWGLEGVTEGSTVFVVGNPGPTSRLLTMAQLEITRDVVTPGTVRALSGRLDAMRAFYEADPETGEAMNLRNQMFSFSNSLKAYAGRLEALRTPEIWTRKRLAEEAFRDSIRADDQLVARFAGVLDEMAAVQAEKGELADGYGAFRLLTSSIGSPAVLRRALVAAQLLEARAAGETEAEEELAERLAAIEDLPDMLEHSMLALQLGDFLRYLGEESGIVRTGLQGMTPERAATALLEASVLADQAGAVQAVEDPGLGQDLAVRLAREVLPEFRAFSEEWSRLESAEQELAAELGRARFEVYGTDVPPDATSSPRITDGVVRPYEYNGTVAPVYTTFFGLYDHYHSYGPGSDWDLPDRWLPAPSELDLDTPLNFISTADTYGGNSGSPAITPDLEMVGLNFDRNIEGLSRDFIYLPEQGRNIMVDVRAITEALDDVYDADRIVEELITGRLVAREADADETVR
ncbi:MAG: S46 family peptidase [Gemmatimonadota bacterium]